MLNSKHLAFIMLTLSTLGVVLTGLHLSVPPRVVSTVAVEQPTPTEVRDRLPNPPQQKEAEKPTPNGSTKPVKEDTQVEQPVSPSPASPDTVSMPAVGFEAPLSETVTVDGVITPPDFDHIFKVTDVTADIYVTHSCRYEDCLGNSLFNLPTGEVFVQRGDTVWVDGQRHTVTEVRTVLKDELPEDSVWDTTGVGIVTCYQNSDYTPSTHNLVVIAEPTDIKE